jgi:hypothetical protein
MRADLLHVIAVYSNPVRWASRLERHTEFEQHMLDSGVSLTTVECQMGERLWQLPDDPHIKRVRVRANSLFWHKENLQNIGIAHAPEAKYIMCSDADIMFRRRGWAADVVHALQQYQVIQPWSDCYDLGPRGEHVQHHKSFCRQWWAGFPVAKEGDKWWDWEGGCYEYAHTGYAWCYTRQALEWLGGLLDICVMGSGDHHMALSLAGKAKFSMPGFVSHGYRHAVMQWQDRALRHISGQIGFMWGTIEHKWHGRKDQRYYKDRWSIIKEWNYDPTTDIKRNSYGVWELAGNKPGMELEMDRYFHSRNEDTNTAV